MLRFAPFLLLLFAGCQRPVAAVLTYAPDPDVVEAEEGDAIDMSQVVAAVQRRLRHLPCRVSLDEWQDVRIEAFDGDQETLDQIDRIVCAAGTFELRIAANSADHKGLIERAGKAEGREIRDDQGRLLGWWVLVDKGSNNKMLVSADLTTREIDRDGVSEVELLVVNDAYQVDGSQLVRAAQSIDRMGRPNVTFQLSKKGGQMMAGLTTDNLPDPVSRCTRKLAIILNGRVLSAPAIQSTIWERGVITGEFTKQETEDLVNVLNAGTMPVQLIQMSVEHVSEGQ